jgi:hypothetical protein
MRGRSDTLGYDMARSTKRRTKHRGNAAGMVETRGVTSARAKQAGGGTGAKKSPASSDPRLRVPTWRSAFIRALFAAVVFAVVMIALMDAKPGGVAITTLLLLGIYTPFGYYFDSFLYRRRMAKMGLTIPATPKAAGPKPTKRKRK